MKKEGNYSLFSRLCFEGALDAWTEVAAEKAARGPGAPRSAPWERKKIGINNNSCRQAHVWKARTIEPRSARIPTNGTNTARPVFLQSATMDVVVARWEDMVYRFTIAEQTIHCTPQQNEIAPKQQAVTTAFASGSAETKSALPLTSVQSLSVPASPSGRELGCC